MKQDCCTQQQSCTVFNIVEESIFDIQHCWTNSINMTSRIFVTPYIWAYRHIFQMSWDRTNIIYRISIRQIRVSELPCKQKFNCQVFLRCTNRWNWTVIYAAKIKLNCKSSRNFAPLWTRFWACDKIEQEILYFAYLLVFYWA